MAFSPRSVSENTYPQVHDGKKILSHDLTDKIEHENIRQVHKKH